MAKSNHKVNVEIGKLETQLTADPAGFTRYGDLMSFCVIVDARHRARELMALGIEAYARINVPVSTKYKFASAIIDLWKAEKYLKKDSIRLNVSPERRELLFEAKAVLEEIALHNDPDFKDMIRLKLAYVLEGLGMMSESLGVLSDLIALQASNGVELAYIIFKASVILKRLGQSAQAIEYLEFLQDDPPRSEGIGRTHVMSFLALVFEQSGQQYNVVLKRTYDLLQEAYVDDLHESGVKPELIQSKVEQLFMRKPVSTSSEIWEALTIQAMEKCEYAFAAELIHQGALKASTKAGLWHSLAEVTLLLNQKETCAKYAEMAYQLTPNSSDIRNLLLLVDPNKWRDKLRTAAPTKNTEISAAEEERMLDAMGGGGSRLKKKEIKASDVDDPLMKLRPVTKEANQNKSPEKAKVTSPPAAEKKKKQKKKATAQKPQDSKQARELLNIAPPTPETIDSKAIMKFERFKERINQLPVHNRPEKPADVSTEAMRYVDFALARNDNIHLYDSTLVALRDR